MFRETTILCCSEKMKCFICCLGCLVGESNHAGGAYIVDVADSKKGGTQGLFYVKGKLTTPARQVQVIESQKRALKILREMANSQ